MAILITSLYNLQHKVSGRRELQWGVAVMPPLENAHLDGVEEPWMER